MIHILLRFGRQNAIRLFSATVPKAEALAAENISSTRQKSKSKRLAAPGTGHRVKAVRGKSTFVFDLLSLQKYYELYGNTMVPHKFSFGRNESGVGHAGSYIGAQVNSIRAYAKIDPKSVSQELRQALDSMGFVWDVPKHRLKLTLQGVLTYKSIYGHDLIPTKFVVPANDPRWDPAIWGSNLGMKLMNIKRRQRGVTDNRTNVLKAAGVDVQRNLNMKADRFVEALLLYRDLFVLPQRTKESVDEVELSDSNGNAPSTDLTAAPKPKTRASADADGVRFTVPRTFTFPVDHPDIPETFKGFPLGDRVYFTLRRGYFKDYREAIESTGLDTSVYT